MSSWNLTAFYLLMHRLGLGYWCFYCLRAVNALMGPRVDKHKTVCANQSKAFIDVWFSSSYHVVYDIYIYIYIFLNIIVSLIELFGFKLFSLVLNKFFSFPFEPWKCFWSECGYQSITKQFLFTSYLRCLTMLRELFELDAELDQTAHI